MLQNSGVTAFTISVLLGENQQLENKYLEDEKYRKMKDHCHYAGGYTLVSLNHFKRSKTILITRENVKLNPGTYCSLIF